MISVNTLTPINVWLHNPTWLCAMLTVNRQTNQYHFFGYNLEERKWEERQACAVEKNAQSFSVIPEDQHQEMVSSLVKKMGYREGMEVKTSFDYRPDVDFVLGGEIMYTSIANMITWGGVILFVGGYWVAKKASKEVPKEDMLNVWLKRKHSEDFVKINSQQKLVYGIINKKWDIVSWDGTISDSWEIASPEDIESSMRKIIQKMGFKSMLTRKGSDHKKFVDTPFHVAQDGIYIRNEDFVAEKIMEGGLWITGKQIHYEEWFLNEIPDFWFIKEDASNPLWKEFEEWVGKTYKSSIQKPIIGSFYGTAQVSKNRMRVLWHENLKAFSDKHVWLTLEEWKTLKDAGEAKENFVSESKKATLEYAFGNTSNIEKTFIVSVGVPSASRKEEFNYLREFIWINFAKVFSASELENRVVSLSFGVINKIQVFSSDGNPKFKLVEEAISIGKFLDELTFAKDFLNKCNVKLPIHVDDKFFESVDDVEENEQERSYVPKKPKISKKDFIERKPVNMLDVWLKEKRSGSIFKIDSKTGMMYGFDNFKWQHVKWDGGFDSTWEILSPEEIESRMAVAINKNFTGVMVTQEEDGSESAKIIDIPFYVSNNKIHVRNEDYVAEVVMENGVWSPVRDIRYYSDWKHIGFPDSWFIKEDSKNPLWEEFLGWVNKSSVDHKKPKWANICVKGRLYFAWSNDLSEIPDDSVWLTLDEWKAILNGVEENKKVEKAVQELMSAPKKSKISKRGKRMCDTLIPVPEKGINLINPSHPIQDYARIVYIGKDSGGTDIFACYLEGSEIVNIEVGNLNNGTY